MSRQSRMTYATMSVPAKALATCIIVTLGVGMLGALGQIVVHDIIPTFFADNPTMAAEMMSQHQERDTAPSDTSESGGNRGDLFADLSAEKLEPQASPFYKGEQ